VGPAAAPQGFQQLAYRAAGVRLATPRSWTITPQSPPLVTVISSGEAVISLWRYPGAFPRTIARAEHAYKRLIAAARRRQPKLHVLSAALRTFDGYPAVELEATEPIGNAERRVRSLHLFTPAAELVLEEYAPPNTFGRVNRLVFEHVWRSLAVGS
jgi:hypothetical protein